MSNLVSVLLLILSGTVLISGVAVTKSIEANMDYMEAQLVMYRTTAHTTAGACEIIDKLWRDRQEGEK